MKHIKIVLFLLSVIWCSICSAQAFRVIKATSQRWAGGVVGHYGTRYNIEIEPTSKKIVPDTVWINGISYPLDFLDKNGNCTRIFDSAAKKTTYSILVGESHNKMNPGNFDTPSDTIAEKPAPVKHFKGAAMVSYNRKHREHFFIIKSFTILKPLNYP